MKQADFLATFRPRLLDALAGYTRERFIKDLGAGLTVGIVALPLAMAFAIASGLKPEAGIWTAILAGAMVAALGGSAVQIAGPAGAFIVIVYGIVERYGLANLLISTSCAGVLMFLLGLLKLGTLVRYVPVSIVVGFTNGIAVLIALSQVKDFFGLKLEAMPADFFSQLHVIAGRLSSTNVWALLLATAAAVIASQAVISGAFSMMQQAVQMGLLPRLEIRHTSETQHGQIYMPRVNMILMLSVICLVIAFGSSSRLASAYGIAVSGDMVITTILAFVLFLKAWKWPLMAVIAVIAPILIVELLFLGANMMKLHDGGYVPVAIAATMCVLIWSWVRGTNHVKQKAADSAISLVKLIAMLDKSQPMSVPGTAVFLTQDPNTAPSALLHNLKHNRVLHSQNFIVTVTVANTPTVSDDKKVTIERLSDRFVRVVMTFGYMERPNVPRGLSLARKRGEKFDIMTTSFFLNRRTFRSARNQGLPLWQERIFIGLSKSAADATAFYGLPSNRVVEMGQQMTI